MFALVCAISLSCFAQEAKPEVKKNNHSERLEAEKVAFITKQLDLSVEEAQAFWPVYNKVEKSQKALSKAERAAFKALNQAMKDKKDENEISNLLDAYVKAAQSNVNMHLKAKKEYEKVLPVEKVAKYYLATERFRRQQIQKLQAPKSQGPRPQYGTQGHTHQGHNPQGMPQNPQK